MNQDENYLHHRSAIRNSKESPLLQLPSEIRNRIWELALGFNHIDIREDIRQRSWPITSTVAIRPTHVLIDKSRPLLPRSFVRPTFAAPKVCRQMYVEASRYMYTLNNFAFDNYRTFDCWIKNRVIGQRRLVTSIDVPYDYLRLYRTGHRQLFHKKFENIKRIGVDVFEPYFAHHTFGVPFIESKNKTLQELKHKEGQDLQIEWTYSGQGGVALFNPL